jgi:cytochrome c553
MDKHYFVEKMKGFRDGTRPSTIMSSHASGYTDAEFVALGNWFANHK